MYNKQQYNNSTVQYTPEQLRQARGTGVYGLIRKCLRYLHQLYILYIFLTSLEWGARRNPLAFFPLFPSLRLPGKNWSTETVQSHCTLHSQIHPQLSFGDLQVMTPMGLPGKTQAYFLSSSCKDQPFMFISFISMMDANRLQCATYDNPAFAVDTEHMGCSVKPGETSVAFQG